MEQAAAMEQTVKIMANREGKYLTFTLAEEEYGIGILKVKEIIGIVPITTVPCTPDYMKGVINLRGKVIPVVDLRLKFGMEAMDYTERTCIIVVDIDVENKKIQMGIVVDSVSEVMNIKAGGYRGYAGFRQSAEYGVYSGNGQNGRSREDLAGYRPGAQPGGNDRSG